MFGNYLWAGLSVSCVNCVKGLRRLLTNRTIACFSVHVFIFNQITAACIRRFAGIEIAHTHHITKCRVLPLPVIPVLAATLSFFLPSPVHTKEVAPLSYWNYIVFSFFVSIVKRPPNLVI